MLHDVLYSWFGLNTQIFLLINNFINKSITQFPLAESLIYLSKFFSIYSFAVMYCVLAFFYFIKIFTGKTTFISAIDKKFDSIISSGICFALFIFTFTILKYSVNLPRPYCSLDSNLFHTLSDNRLQRCLSSFPSAHTGVAIIIIYYLWEYMNNISKIFGCALIFMVATSRISMAMHYPADIVYSGIITYFIIKLGNKIYTILKPKLLQIVSYIIPL